MIAELIDHAWYTIKYYEVFSWGALIFVGFLYQAIDYARFRRLYLPPFSHYEVQEKENKT